MPCTTSSASAMPGTAFGLTKETIWIWSIPVCASASISAILRVVGIAPFSNWNPSRGPSSLICTRFGKSLMTSRSRSVFRLTAGLDGDDLALAQRFDLGRFEAEFGQNLVRMLADCRRLAAQRHVVIADFDGQPRNFCPHPVWKSNIEHTAAGVELRVVEQVAGFCDRREWNIDTIEQFGKLVELVARDDCRDQRPEGRVLQQVAAREMLAEAAPMAIAGQPNENLFAVGGLERLVDRPGAFARRH